MDRNGIFPIQAIEGDHIMNVTERSPLSGWAVGIGVTERELEAPVRETVFAAGVVGTVISALSLLLAFRIARQITGPIQELENKAVAIVGGEPATLGASFPEVTRVWNSLQAAVGGLPNTGWRASSARWTASTARRRSALPCWTATAATCASTRRWPT